MRKRLSELGVRRAYGATRNNLIYQIMTESLIQTLIGGLLGLILSYIAAYALREMLYEGAMVPFTSLLSPVTFLSAFLFCILLNVLATAAYSQIWIPLTSQPNI